MTNAQRKAEIEAEAHRLAKGGLSFRQLELRLRVRWPEAPTVLKDDWLRQQLKLESQGRSIFDA